MKNDVNPVALGFVGCGRITATRHLPALKSVPQARVLAVTDTDPQCLQRVADRFGIPRRYSTFEELLADKEIEAVAICVPARWHVPLSLAVLDAGKHLFVEKPLALNAAESQTLVNRANDSSLTAMVGFNLRWHRLVRQAKSVLQSGSLGDLKIIRTTFTSASRHSADMPSWRTKPELGGGVLMEQAIHHFDLWRFLLQDEVEEVFASAVNEDESAVVVARMASGLLVSSTFSEGTANENEILFCGSEARLWLSCYHFDGIEILPASNHPGDLKIRIKKIGSLIKQSPQIMSQYFQGSDFIASYKNEWLHFFDCVRQKKPAEPSLYDGHRSVQILTAVLESADKNVPVKVNRISEGIP